MERRGKARGKGKKKVSAEIRAKQTLQYSSWIITHGASGPALTPEMFFEYDSHVSKGMINVDECYTTTDRVLNYTLIHVEKKIRGTNIQNFVEHVKTEYAIVQQHITAYEPIDTVVEKDADGTMRINPIFKLILQHKLEQHPHFQQWYKDEIPKSGGLLNIHRLNSNYPTLREFIATFSSFSTSLGKRHTICSPRELGVNPQMEMERSDTTSFTASPAAAAKCSKTNEEIAAIIAERDRKIELLETEINYLKEVNQLKSHHREFEELKALLIENGESINNLRVPITTTAEKMDHLHEELQTVKKTQEQFDELEAQHKHDQTVIASDAAKRGHIARKTNSLEKELEQRATAEELVDKVIEGFQAAIYEGRVQHSLVQTGAVAAFADEWTGKAGYERLPEFKGKIIHFHLSKPGKTYRRPEVPTKQIPSDQAIRMCMDYMVHYGFGGKFTLMQDSTIGHRFTLTCYDGPIYGPNTTEEIVSVLLAHIEFLYKQLRLRNYFDPKPITDFAADPDAFSRPEMADWKLDEAHLKEYFKYGGRFKEFYRKKIQKYQGAKPFKGKVDIFFRYYTFLHKCQIHEGFSGKGVAKLLEQFSLPHYSQETLDEMVMPLNNHMVGLRARLCDVFPENHAYDDIVQRAMEELEKQQPDWKVISEGKHKDWVKTRNKS